MSYGDDAVREVYRRFAGGELPKDEAISLVPETWSDAEHPFEALGARKWGELWDYIGYTHNGEVASRPVHSLTLLRGSDSAHRHGWSWTTERRIADHYAGKGLHRNYGCIWEAEVEPRRLLAFIDLRDGIEPEFVVRTEGLVITPHAWQNAGGHSGMM